MIKRRSLLSLAGIGLLTPAVLTACSSKGAPAAAGSAGPSGTGDYEIGRASCRERV